MLWSRIVLLHDSLAPVPAEIAMPVAFEPQNTELRISVPLQIAPGQSR